MTVYLAGFCFELENSTFAPEAGATVAKGETVQTGASFVRSVPCGRVSVMASSSVAIIAAFPLQAKLSKSQSTLRVGSVPASGG
ncbi:MAG: hypothetical protein NTW21_09365 [Verrucomicrobia bacterium]|nr:hypothetical protein [Verrucomicrobiota bacterium]